MELSEDNLDIRKMRCLLDAAQVGWIEKSPEEGVAIFLHCWGMLLIYRMIR